MVIRKMGRVGWDWDTGRVSGGGFLVKLLWIRRCGVILRRVILVLLPLLIICVIGLRFSCCRWRWLLLLILLLIVLLIFRRIIHACFLKFLLKVQIVFVNRHGLAIPIVTYKYYDQYDVHCPARWKWVGKFDPTFFSFTLR